MNNAIKIPHEMMVHLDGKQLEAVAKMLMGAVDAREKHENSSYEEGYHCGYNGYEREYGLMDREIFDIGYEDGQADDAAGRANCMTKMRMSA